MARVSVTVTVAVTVISFFFAISPSVARITVNKPNHVVSVRQPTNHLQGSDVTGSIRLPSESFENRAKENKPEPDNDEIMYIEARPEPKVEPARPVVVPKRSVVRFRPMSRHFRWRAKLPYRLCRQDEFENGGDGHETTPFQIPYGNGILLTFEKNDGVSDDQEFVPPKYSQFLSHHDPRHRHHIPADEEMVSTRFSGNDREKDQIRDIRGKVSNRVKVEKPERPKVDGEKRDDNENEKNEDSLRRRIRKFLGQYFG